MEKTLAIVKPDAAAAGNIGNIIAIIEKNGFKILALRMQRLTRAEAEGFYEVHRERPFFGELVEFMTEGPVVLMALEREDAIAKWRDLMGPTDPAKAPAGAIRRLYGTDIGRNASHGSDSVENAATELAWFFRASELA